MSTALRPFLRLHSRVCLDFPFRQVSYSHASFVRGYCRRQGEALEGKGSSTTYCSVIEEVGGAMLDHTNAKPLDRLCILSPPSAPLRFRCMRPAPAERRPDSSLHDCTSRSIVHLPTPAAYVICARYADYNIVRLTTCRCLDGPLCTFIAE